MIDLETTGLSFDNTAILQIAAVRFNLKERTVDHNFFDRCLLIPPGRYWNEDTRNWWLKDKREILHTIMQRAEEPRVVLEALQIYAGRDAVFWSKPSHFDHSFLGSYFNQYGLSNPFPHYTAHNLRSFVDGLYFPRPSVDWTKKLEFTGPAHNALFDTLHQVRALFAAVEDTAKKEIMDLAAERVTPLPQKVVMVSTPRSGFDDLDDDIPF